MSIPESQLSRWSHHGPQDASIRTHEAIKRVLAAFSWPKEVSYDSYLQGSYRNNTNIRGDSDVDLVLELQSMSRHDTGILSEYDRNRLIGSFAPATYEWNDFRRDALRALETGFEKHLVAQGNTSIRLKANPPRLAADIVVCMEHRKYLSYHSYNEHSSWNDGR